MLRGAASFRLLFFATLGSGVGTWMATIALTADVADRTHSPWWVSALFVVTFFPSVVVGLVAGPLIDRLSRKRLIVASDLVRLAVFAALPFVSSAAAIIVLAAIAGIANSFFRPAVLAGVPNLVAEEDLAHGTSLLQATDWAATTLGPVLGGVIVSASGPDLVYWINAATFLLSALLLMRIPARLLQSEQAITRGHWRDLAEGMSCVPPLGRAAHRARRVRLRDARRRADQRLRDLPRRARVASRRVRVRPAVDRDRLRPRHRQPDQRRLLEQREVTRVYPLAFLPWAVGILGAGVAPNIWVAAVAMVLAGFGNGLTFPMTVLIVQRYTVDRLRGRAFTVVISAHNLLLGIAMVSAGALTETVGPRWTYTIASLLLVCGAASALALSRGIRTQGVVAQQQAA